MVKLDRRQQKREVLRQFFDAFEHAGEPVEVVCQLLDAFEHKREPVLLDV